MRYAIVQAGVVVNVVLADSPDLAGAGAVQSDTASPGDSYSGGIFTPAPVVPRVPQTTTMFRFIQALDDVLGITETDVEAALAAMPAGRDKRRMRAWWRVSSAVARKGQAMNEFQALLGELTNVQIRDVFVAAEQVAE